MSLLRWVKVVDYHPAGEDVLDGKIRYATGPVRRHLDGFDRTQAWSGRVAFTHG